MLFNTINDLKFRQPLPKLEEVVKLLELVPTERTKKIQEQIKEVDEAIKKESLQEEELRQMEEQKKKKEQFNIKIPAQVYYEYIPPSQKKQLAAYYTFVPSDVQIFRVPATMLGYNVLGCTFIGTNVVYIRDTLHGDEFEEVKRHEINHVTHPWMTEDQIRYKTKVELPFEARFH